MFVVRSTQQLSRTIKTIVYRVYCVLLFAACYRCAGCHTVYWLLVRQQCVATSGDAQTSPIAVSYCFEVGVDVQFYLAVDLLLIVITHRQCVEPLMLMVSN